MIHDLFHAPGERRSALIALARELAASFAEGKNLPAVFIALSRQRRFKNLSAALLVIAKELQGGRAVAEAFSGRENIFGSFFCRTASSGFLSENSGLFFSRLAGHLEKDERFRKRIACVLRYPLLFTAGATGAMITILALIIPDAVQTISAVSGKLPRSSQIALNVFSTPQTLLLLLLASLVLLFACIGCSIKVFHGSGRCVCVFPFLSNLCRKFSLRRVSSGIHFLISNGIGIPEALVIAAEAEGRSPLRIKLLRAAEEIRRGRAPLISALKDADGIFPPSVFYALSKAQDLEREDMLFRKIAGFYEEEIEAALTAAILIIEPAIVAIAGFIGAGVLAALYLPLLRISIFR
ncbi:MAG: type II secretion system F family protein [Chitinispirillaceae bacterium]|nr:type II secretion system F family protein [Chitinispirillaceae bacterium]